MVESLAIEGVFTRDQLRICRVSNQLVGYHTRPGGRWVRVLPGVYAVAGKPFNALFAAQQWGGELAVLSHHAAALVLELDGI
jgi:hypothetical protein